MLWCSGMKILVFNLAGYQADLVSYRSRCESFLFSLWTQLLGGWHLLPSVGQFWVVASDNENQALAFLFSAAFFLYFLSLHMFFLSLHVSQCVQNSVVLYTPNLKLSSLQIRLAGELEICLTVQELPSVFICRVFHCPVIEVPAYILPCQEFVTCDPSRAPSCSVFSRCRYKINMCCSVGFLPCWKTLGEL